MSFFSGQKFTFKHYIMVHSWSWSPLISLTVLKYISLSSNFGRIAILRNELFLRYDENYRHSIVSSTYLII